MKRIYNDGDRSHAIEVLAQTKNLAKTARLTGFPRKSIEYWARETGVLSALRSARSSASSSQDGEQNARGRRMDATDIREVPIAKWTKGMHLNLDEMANPEKVKAATLRDNVIAAGTAQDKLNILRGGATQRTEVRISLVAPGALKALPPGVVEGDLRVLGDSGRQSDDADGGDVGNAQRATRSPFGGLASTVIPGGRGNG